MFLILVFPEKNGEVHASGPLTLAQACSVSAHACSALAMLTLMAAIFLIAGFALHASSFVYTFDFSE